MAYNIHCEKCGHEFEVEKWHPGMPCPKCQASDTVPMTKMGEPAPDRKPSLAEDKRNAAAAGWKNSPVVAGIAIAVIVATWIVLGIWKFKKPPRMKVEVWAVCVECNERVKKFTAEVRDGADCVKCGKKATVHTIYECRGEKDKGCGHVFAYIPPPSPRSSSQDPKKWENMSEEERNKMMMEVDRDMMEHEQARMEASKCPKCESYNTGPVYTEEQKKKFEELRKKYAKKKSKKK